MIKKKDNKISDNFICFETWKGTRTYYRISDITYIIHKTNNNYEIHFKNEDVQEIPYRNVPYILLKYILDNTLTIVKL